METVQQSPSSQEYEGRPLISHQQPKTLLDDSVGDEDNDNTEAYSYTSSDRSDYTVSSTSSEYGTNACVAYADLHGSEYSSEGTARYGLACDAEAAGYSADGGVCFAHVDYAVKGDEDESGYEDVSKAEPASDSIYACIAEYEEIDQEDDEVDESDLEDYYVTIADAEVPHQALVQRKTSAMSCFAALLNPHQLLFGWKSQIPWACQTTLRTWTRILSTRMGVQLATAGSNTPATVAFLRRTLKEYNKRAPKTIQFHETLPSDFLRKIQTVFDMAKQKPTRYKHVIGISCFPINMSLPKSHWKDLDVLNSLIADSEAKQKSNALVLASTTAAADRLGQLEKVITDFYSKRHNLREDQLKAYVADTGLGFRIMHSSVFALKAMSALAKKGQSILLPEPTHPTLSVWFNVFQYTTGVIPRYYRRDPSRSWMLDIGDLQEKLEDETTAAVFMSNPSIMSGGISSYRELSIVTSMLAKKRIPLIMEETMDYLTYDPLQKPHSVLELKPSSPVIVISSSYRWMIFGARGLTLAWAMVYDPESLLPESVHESLQAARAQSMKMSAGLPSPSTLSTLLHFDGWSHDIARYLAKNMNIACGVLSKTPGLIVGQPKSGYFLIVLLDLDAFEGKFANDSEFTMALFNEESLKVVCGSVLLGWDNSFGLEMYMRRDLLIEACDRIDQFCRRRVFRAC